MRTEDMIQPPCGCPECVQAGVSTLERRREPRTGELLHGYPLKRWYDAKAAFVTQARKAVGARGRHARGFEKLVNG